MVPCAEMIDLPHTATEVLPSSFPGTAPVADRPSAAKVWLSLPWPMKFAPPTATAELRSPPPLACATPSSAKAVLPLPPTAVACVPIGEMPRLTASAALP